MHTNPMLSFLCDMRWSLGIRQSTGEWPIVDQWRKRWWRYWCPREVCPRGMIRSPTLRELLTKGV